MKIAFRADSSYEIGVGHIMRCMNIALKDDIFICRDYNGNIGEIVNSKGFGVRYICESKSEKEEAEQCIKIINEYNIDAMVIDSYILGNTFNETVRESGIKCMVIDDLAEREIEADMVINHNPYSNSEMYRGKTTAKVIAGNKYTMLREEFTAEMPETLIRNNIENILITLGGSDPENITGSIAEMLKNIKYKIKIIVGKSNKNSLKLREFYKNDQGIEILENISDMRSFIEESDFVICAGGTTLWEVIYLGIPFGVVQIAENQKYSVEYVRENGLGLVFEKEKGIEKIIELIDGYSFEKRKNNSVKCRNLFDGYGAKRIRKEIESI